MTAAHLGESYGAVASVLARYFDGLYNSDARALSALFHPQAHYVCAVEGDYVYRTMDEYLSIVAGRPSPASRNEARRDSIVSIEFAGPAIAVARVNCAIGARYFTDALTLIREDGAWRIMSKIFHYEESAAAD